MSERLPRTSIAGYFRAISGILQTQVKILTPVIVHSGEMGSNDCQAFADLLRKYLPARFGVDTGFVVNAESDSLSKEYFERQLGRRCSDSSISSQSDILLVDVLHNAPLCVEAVFRVFPVEMVLGVIEVTRDLDREKLIEDYQKLARVRSLAARESKHYNSFTGTEDPGTLRPRAYVVGLRSRIRLEEIKDSLEDNDDLRPNGVYLMDRDLLFIRRPFSKDFIRIDSDALFHFLTILRMHVESFPIGPADLSAYLPVVASMAFPPRRPADAGMPCDEASLEPTSAGEPPPLVEPTGPTELTDTLGPAGPDDL